MAQIRVVETYEIDLQATPARSFRGRDGEKVEMEAQAARRATVAVCEYDEYKLPFVLPQGFDASKVRPNVILHVECAGLENVRPLKVKNVNRIIEVRK